MRSGSAVTVWNYFPWQNRAKLGNIVKFIQCTSLYINLLFIELLYSFNIIWGPAPPEHQPEPTTPERPPVPALHERSQEPAPPERPQEPAPPEHPPEPAPPERPQEPAPPESSLLPSPWTRHGRPSPLPRPGGLPCLHPGVAQLFLPGVYVSVQDAPLGRGG